MTPLKQLTRAAYGIQIADQVALVSVPLIAALIFGASAEVIGILVACQSLAHLLGSIPFGILVDAYQQRSLVIAATLISLLGFAGATAAVWMGGLFWFGLFVVISGFGIVLFTLSVLSILPKVVGATGLSAANASVELPRALASFIVPLGIGVAVAYVSPLWLFALAIFAAAYAWAATQKLPRFEQQPRSTSTGIFRSIAEGGIYVMQHNLLRAILFCAIFWNFAFSVLLVAMVPLIRDVYMADPGTFGIALAAFGAGAIVGSWISRRFAAVIPPNLVLLFGPGASILAPVILLLVSGGGALPLVYLAFFTIGFGPSMWLIAQNSVRQIVSPGHMLGRVNAVIQTAIYGMRPLAALIGGAVVGATSPQTGLMLVLGGFALSFLAAAFSGLRQVSSFEHLKVAQPV